MYRFQNGTAQLASQLKNVLKKTKEFNILQERKLTSKFVFFTEFTINKCNEATLKATVMVFLIRRSVSMLFDFMFSSFSFIKK